jgi:streptogramin lyase
MSPGWKASFAAVQAFFLVAASDGSAFAQGVKLRAAPSVYLDSAGAGLLAPEGVACRGKQLAVADTGKGRIVLYALGDRMATPQAEFAVAELSHPVELHFDPKGELLVLDGKSRRIGRVGTGGGFQGFVAIESGAGAAPVPTAFAVAADGSLHVLDVAGGRVLVTTGAGKFVRQILLPADCRAPSGVAVDSTGKVFVADSAQPRLYAAAKDQSTMVPITGSLREDMDFAGALAVDEQRNVFVLDEHGGGIVLFGADGSFRGRQGAYGWLDGQLRWPAALCVGADGFVAVADRENNRVVTYLIAP